MICADCQEPQDPEAVVWLYEDDRVRCDECRAEDLRGDLLDRDDHGHPYRARELTMRETRTQQDDREFEDARRRATEPNHDRREPEAGQEFASRFPYADERKPRVRVVGIINLEPRA